MTGPGPAHTRFDELAAGYALHALQPDEELEFLSHARRCGHCQQSLAHYAGVTEAMADLTPAAEPSPQLEARIIAAATSQAPGDRGAASPPQPTARPGAAQNQPGQRPPVRVIALRRRPRSVKVAVAAAAAVIAAAGIWGGLAATSGPAQPPLTACAQAHHCPVVVLTAAATHRTAAKVIIRDGTAWMEPTAMTANPADEIYVLWQITGAHIPLAVGSFDIRPGQHTPIRIGALAVPFPTTRAFAVSLEHGHAIPPSPSHPVALGQVPT